MSVEWRFPSSSGNDTVAFTLAGLVDMNADATLWRVQLLTTFPDRSRSTGHRDAAAEHEIRLGQLVLQATSLRELLRHLQDWLVTCEPFTMALSSTPGQRTIVSVGPDPRLICNRAKPALVFEYEGIAAELRFHTVVDETCVRIAAGTLDSALVSLSAART